MAASYCRYDVDPVAASPLTAFGLEAEGGEFKDTTAPEEVVLLDGVAVPVGQLQEYSGEVRFLPVSDAVLAFAARAASGYPWSALTEYSLGFAADGVLSVFHYAKFGALTLEARVNELLRATMRWQARKKVETTPGSPSAGSGTPFAWHQAAVTATGVTAGVQSFSIERDNNLRAYTDVVGGAAAGEKRNPKGTREGNDVVTVRFNTQEPVAAADRGNLDDEVDATLSFQAAFTNGVGLLTLTVTGLYNTDGGGTLRKLEDDPDYQYELRAPANSNALAISYV